ncbi:GNAT family N-acetyltransferase [Actinospica durhamensis]|uniref:GNAT family N-acetyltransferase n=1 Tax=Actinospica durhamensis TaxID=1508375 RepID=A0A941IPC8_9ACTN|nr:GNAT family N-acetyltransferase [Actinospica durhamensis]MBR7834989.1 GNAT family N-acetyltransferase [Actinospica durhamensis]
MAATAAGHVRGAEPADIPALRRIAVDTLRWDGPDAGSLVDLVWPHERPELAVVAVENAVPVGFALGSVRGESGHINLLAVTPQARHRGHARALLRELEARLEAAGVQRIHVGGASPRFAWAGVDVRYSAAGFLLESAGYVRAYQAVNMTVDLADAGTRLDTAEAEKALAAQGVTLRPLREDDRAAITPWLASFGGTWLEETLATLERPGARCHLAVRADGGADGADPTAAYLGFACHGVNRADWFGPMGTREGERGRGIGSVLLRRCLADLREAGHESAQIAWVGPTVFYAKVVDAYVERVFWIYSKEA